MDSTVCTALLNKALNQEQVIAVHIDNGFMRKRESQSVEEALTKLGIKLKGAAAAAAASSHTSMLVLEVDSVELCLTLFFSPSRLRSGERSSHLLQRHDNPPHLRGGPDATQTHQ